MKTFKKQTFENQEIELDNRVFVSFIFKNCLFRYSGGDCRFEGGLTVENPTFRFLGRAHNTVFLLESFGLLKKDPERILKIDLGTHPPQA